MKYKARETLNKLSKIELSKTDKAAVAGMRFTIEMDAATDVTDQATLGGK